MALCVLRTVAALAFALGVRAREAGIVAAVSAYAVLLQHPFAFMSTLHLLFEGTLLLALTDCDAELALRPRPARDPSSGLRLMQLFVASVYVWAGLGKLRPDWFDGRVLEVLARQRWLSGPVAHLLLGSAATRAVVAWIIGLGEIAAGPLLLFRRTRALGLATALGFHLAVQTMARPDLIGLVMAALLVAYLPGLTLRRAAS
jgi:hypothetical protein